MPTLRLRIFLRSLAERPLLRLFAALLALAAGALAYRGTLWFLAFLGRYPFAARPIEEKSLETLFLLLSAAVLLSALPGALAVLFDAEDLHLLLAWPIPGFRVFAWKLLDLYLSTAFLPLLLTLPVLAAVGVGHRAPGVYYLAAAAAALVLYALPVALGGTLSLLFLRLAPAGRAREWAAAGSAVLGGLLVYALRAARPEALLGRAFENPEALRAFIARWARSGPPFLPSTWAARATEAGLLGHVSPALLALLALAAVWFLALIAAAARAYRAGWVRGLEGSATHRPPAPPAAWERGLYRLGAVGALWVRDLRRFFRDPVQVSQLMLVAVLVLLYWTSLAAMPLEGLVFQRVVGFLHVAFEGLVIVAVGLRLAFPLFGLEAPGRWLVITAPLAPAGLVWSRFAFALAFLLPLGLSLGAWVPRAVGLPPGVALVSAASGVTAAFAVAGLGVGLGALWPARNPVHAGEIALWVGGLLYMVLGLFFAASLAVLDAYPLYRLLSGLPFFGTEAAGLWAGLLGLAALGFGVVPLFLALRALASDPSRG